jgi:hypothetical protein
MFIVSPAPIAAVCATILAAIASSFVAPAARDVTIAFWPMCAAIATSWSAPSWSAAAFAVASVATCCLLISLAARLSKCV